MNESEAETQAAANRLRYKPRDQWWNRDGDDRTYEISEHAIAVVPAPHPVVIYSPKETGSLKRVMPASVFFAYFRPTEKIR